MSQYFLPTSWILLKQLFLSPEWALSRGIIVKYMPCDRDSVSLMKKPQFKFWTGYMWNLTLCACLLKFIQGISYWWGHCSSPFWMGCQQISCWKIPSSSSCYVITKKASRNSWRGKMTEIYYQHGCSPHCSLYISLVLIGRICLN